MRKPIKVTTYTPDSQLRNPRLLLREMLFDLSASRELAWRLFVRNISAQYRQTMFGYLWAFLPPIFTTAVWVYLNSQKIFNIGETNIPYPVFVLVGTVLWQTFVDALNSPLKLVTESKSMLTKINFPREALILAGLGEVFFNFAIRIILLIAIFLWFKISVPITITLVPFGILSLICFGLMIGMLLTPLGILYTDIGRGITILTQFWFFLTPVIYPMPESWPASLLAKINPITPILLTTREWLTTGHSEHITGIIVVTIISLLMLMFGWLLYRISMPHLIARMSA